jgi:type I restriction enzyme S subunit
MSDVPEGYRMSEVGVIPEAWDVFEFGQLIDYTKGFAFKSKDYRADGIRIIRVSDTTFDSIKEENQIYIDEISSNQYQKWKLEEDDLILSTVGSKPPLYDSMVGKVIIIQKKYEGSLLNQNAVLIRAKKKTKFKQQILLHHFRTKKYLKYIESIFRGNANQASITLEELFQFQIPLPKLEKEQQAIASALSDVDALITALEQLIIKKRNIKQGAMQQLLTGKKRLPGFGGEWEVKKLGEYSEFYKGKGLSKSEITANGKYKCIHYGELFTTYNEEIKEVFSRTDKKDNFFLSLVNDVLMPTSDVTPNGLATASCIKENEVILGGDVLVIRAFADVLDGIFLSYGITQNKKQIMQLVSGSTVYHLYGSDMKKYQFSIPSTIEEQQAIAQILSDMDTEIEALEQKRDKYKAIKQGMMQELLTGERRLA